jgi:hypothetical protein
MRSNRHDPQGSPLPENSVSNLIDPRQNEDKERADRYLAEARRRAELKAARLDALHGPRPYDRERDEWKAVPDASAR